jgi:RimJ/RimL family protein N-acetyltransferase
MKNIENELSSEVELNTLVQSIYSESIQMGFKSNDYIKLMNELLDMTISNKKSVEKYLTNDNIGNLTATDLPIKTKNLTIRLYNAKIDKEFVAKWLKEENNKLFLLSTTRKHNLEVESIISDDRNIFATITIKKDLPIGLLALINIDKENSKGEMRKMLGDISQRGKGYAKEASAVWLKYCSEYLELNKIYINTIETNIKNITLNRQIGFKIEGLLKRELLISGVEHDVLRMAYFKS